MRFFKNLLSLLLLFVLSLNGASCTKKMEYPDDFLNETVAEPSWDDEGVALPKENEIINGEVQIDLPSDNEGVALPKETEIINGEVQIDLPSDNEGVALPKETEIINGEVQIDLPSDNEGVALPKETEIINGEVQIDLPSDKFLLKIEKDYRQFEKKNGGYDTAYYVKNYFGFYDGAVPVILVGEDLEYVDEITNDTIDGYEFQYPNGNQMEIWFFGTFYSLSEAYKEKIITKDELNLLHQVYYDKSEKTDHGFEKYNNARRHFTRLSPSLQKKLKKSYKKISNFPLCLYDFEVKKWSNYCYGNYNGCVVIFSPGDLTVEEAYSVAGITFTHSQNINLYGYYKGKMYSLKEAYEKGYITKEEIATAKEKHIAIQQYMHWKRWGT